MGSALVILLETVLQCEAIYRRSALLVAGAASIMRFSHPRVLLAAYEAAALRFWIGEISRKLEDQGHGGSPS